MGVDLEVKVVGERAVEYKLRTAGGTSERGPGGRWSPVVYGLWLVAAWAVSSWLRDPRSTIAKQGPMHDLWLLGLASGAVLVALILTKIHGAAIVEESVLVIPSVGVELLRRRRDGTVLRRAFVDRAEIAAVVVNEAIVFSDVVYYIAFMLKRGDRMVLAFEHFRPRVAILQEMFTQIRGALFPEGVAAMRMPEFS